MKMGSSLLCCVIFSWGVLASEAVSRKLPKMPFLAEQHERWMAQVGRTYESAEEKENRLKIFIDNLNSIAEFHKYGESLSYNMSVNKFTDLTREEFLGRYTGFTMPTPPFRPTDYANPDYYPPSAPTSDIPDSIDWREQGAVTPVKNQGSCGCCWAFSATGAVEGIIKIKEGNLASLSEQELVDCARNGNNGCGGGNMDNAFEYIRVKGIATEDEYAYQGSEGESCLEVSSAAQITGYQSVPKDEVSLMMAVSAQPVSVALDASNFQLYEGGVFSGDCGTTLNHGVLVVGYGTAEDGTNYWLVKNSWGPDWGENGYIRILRDSGLQGGLCGIALLASYPTIL